MEILPTSLPELFKPFRTVSCKEKPGNMKFQNFEKNPKKITSINVLAHIVLHIVLYSTKKYSEAPAPGQGTSRKGPCRLAYGILSHRLGQSENPMNI